MCWDDNEDNDFAYVQGKINSCSGPNQQNRGDELELLMCAKRAWGGRLNSFKCFIYAHKM